MCNFKMFTFKIKAFVSQIDAFSTTTSSQFEMLILSSKTESGTSKTGALFVTIPVDTVTGLDSPRDLSKSGEAFLCLCNIEWSAWSEKSPGGRGMSCVRNSRTSIHQSKIAISLMLFKTIVKLEPLCVMR